MKYFFFLLLLVGSRLFAQNIPEVVVTRGHNDYLSALTISKDGKYLLSAGVDKTIKVWDVNSTKEFRTFDDLNGRVYDLVFFDDNNRFVAVSDDYEIVGYEISSGNRLFYQKLDGLQYRSVGITKNQKEIVFCEGGYLKFYDLELDSIKQTEIVASHLVNHRISNQIYALDHLGNLAQVNASTKEVVSSKRLFPKYNYPFTKMDVSTDGNYIVCGFRDSVLRVFDVNLMEFSYESKPYPSLIIDVKFDEKTNNIYVAGESRIEVFNHKTKEIVQTHDLGMFSSQLLTSHPKGNIVVYGQNTDIQFYAVEEDVVFKKLESKVPPINSFTLSPNGKYLAVATNKINIQLWNLEQNRVERTINAFFPCIFSRDSEYLYAQNYQMRMRKIHVSDSSKTENLETNFQLKNAIAISKDGKWLATSNMDFSISIHNLEQKAIVKVLRGHTGMVNTLDFHPTEPYLVSSGYDVNVKVWNYETGELMKSLTGQTICISSVKFSNNGKLLASASWDKTISLWETSSFSFVGQLTGGHTSPILSMDFSSDDQQLFTSSGNDAVSIKDNSVSVWNLEEKKLVCKLPKQEASVNHVQFDHQSKMLVSSSLDGSIRFFNTTECKEVATYLSISQNDFMIYTPDNYYLASKKAQECVGFRLGKELVPFEQFDIYLNRPDIIAKRIGKTPSNIINAYEYLHKKRLKRFNLEQGDLKIDYHVPTISVETEVNLVTTKGKALFDLAAKDDKYGLNGIIVYVNDAPVFGEQGFKVSGKSVKETLEIPLVNGVNKIQFIARNKNGAKSSIQTVEIIKKGEDEPGDLYLLSIGVSSYENSSFNLSYAAKDAKDIVNQLLKTNLKFKNKFVDTLLNENATVDNFERLAKKLSEKVQHNDMVIIFFAGHGLLDADFEYYFGMHDVDFKSPAKNGLSYEKIHALLNALKAYKKLLLMDTCHSGELDKDEIEINEEKQGEDSDFIFRSAGEPIVLEESFGAKNVALVSEDLLQDTRKGSGAHVISSAGGAEFAMESDELQNGLFTYAFLTTLKKVESGRAQSNSNGIKVSELKAVVNATVLAKSDNMQQPTSREINLSQDFVLFK